MIKTAEQNDVLTRVGRGTPAGELLRRYWHMVGFTAELSDKRPTKKVRLLGEDLVLFRMPSDGDDGRPRYGLLGERCPHRLASLARGRVDSAGIRCPYHGWKFSPDGACLEQPAEPARSRYKDRIQQPAYPVQALGGALFAYLGPLPAPLLPRWDVLVREDGRRYGVIDSIIEANWLQVMENSVDPAHFFWLHGSLSSGDFLAHYVGSAPTRQYEEQHEIIEFEYGFMKRRSTPGASEQHPLLFPVNLRLVIDLPAFRRQGYRLAAAADAAEETQRFQHSMQIRVPVDDTHTQHYQVHFVPSPTRRTPVDGDIQFEHAQLKDEHGEYNMNYVLAQDAMAWETQGPIVDRTQEHLAHSDHGIVVYRKALQAQIDRVQQGLDPMGVRRDPVHDRMIEFDIWHERLGLSRTET